MSDLIKHPTNQFDVQIALIKAIARVLISVAGVAIAAISALHYLRP